MQHNKVTTSSSNSVYLTFSLINNRFVSYNRTKLTYVVYKTLLMYINGKKSELTIVERVQDFWNGSRY